MLLVRMRSSRLATVLFVTCCGLCAAQGAAQRTVTGLVVNSATNEPIRRALVAAGAALVFTGPDGRFQLEGIPEGQIMIAAQKPGYFDCATANCGPYPSPARLTITVQAGTNDVLLKLIPESKIEGRIVDEEGEPVSGIQLEVLGEHISAGLKELRPDGGAVTNENGYYRVEKLFPGTYKIETLPRPAFPTDPPSASEPPAQLYPQHFYPDTPDRSSAQPLDLKAGQVARADFILRPRRAFQIAGSISPAVPGISVNVEDTEGEQVNAPVQFDPKSGKFSLSLVPAGTWTIRCVYQASEGHGLYATETVTVGSSDVKGLRILLQPFASLAVKVVNGSTEGQRAQVPITLREHSGKNLLFPSPAPATTPDSPYFIAGVPPGSYRVLVYGLDSQCVDSLTSGNADLTQEDLVVAPGSQAQPINVALRNDCATLQVTVNSENQGAKLAVVLVPASHVMEPITAQLDATGSYVFNGLGPGEYQVYAFSSIDGLEYANPEAMREFAGQQITLAPNQRANLTLAVNVRGDK